VILVGGIGRPGSSETMFREAGELNLAQSRVDIHAETGADGRFSLPHLPPGR
jgi:hypothetical protein